MSKEGLHSALSTARGTFHHCKLAKQFCSEQLNVDPFFPDCACQSSRLAWEPTIRGGRPDSETHTLWVALAICLRTAPVFARLMLVPTKSKFLSATNGG